MTKRPAFLAAAVPFLLLADVALAQTGGPRPPLLWMPVPDLEPIVVEPLPPPPPPALVLVLPEAPPYVPFLQLAPPSLPSAVKKLIEQAIRNDDPDAVNAVIKIALKSQPYDEGEIKAMQKAYQDRKTKEAADKLAANERRIRESHWDQLWTGQIELGGFRSTGNTNNFGFSGALKANRKGIKWEHILLASADYQEDDGSVSKSQYSGSYQARYTLSDGYFTYGKGMYERDRIQGFKNRYTGSGGLGYRLIKTKAMTLSVEAGPALRRIDYVDEPSATTWSASTSLDWDWTISPTMKLTEDFSSYIGTDNSTFTSKTALEAGMTKRLKLKLSYSIEHETSPPDGSLKTDTVSRFALVYGF